MDAAAQVAGPSAPVIAMASPAALRVAASQRLDERLLLEPLASPGEWHWHGARIIS